VTSKSVLCLSRRCQASQGGSLGGRDKALSQRLKPRRVPSLARSQAHSGKWGGGHDRLARTAAYPPPSYAMKNYLEVQFCSVNLPTISSCPYSPSKDQDQEDLGGQQRKTVAIRLGAVAIENCLSTRASEPPKGGSPYCMNGRDSCKKDHCGIITLVLAMLIGCALDRKSLQSIARHGLCSAAHSRPGLRARWRLRS
jgi:hypothetical protein